MGRRTYGLLVIVGLVSRAVVAAPVAEPLFETEVLPILRAHCFSCHGEGEQLEGGLDLRLVRSLLQGGESGPAVVAGRHAESVLYQRVASREMPPEGKTPLTAAQLAIITRWIDAGAKTRRDESAGVPTSWITPEDRAFWSFQPVRRPTVPVTNREGTPIDRFVDTALTNQGLTRSPQADPRTLLRRLSYTLIGLPPSHDDVEAFAADPSPERYAAWVEAGLASPQFGERWSRMWLDLVRYVDQTPDYLTSAERAWLYRDWVVKALNDDRSYDEFVRLQLAADLLEGVAPEDYAALGLLGLSPTYWKELRLAPSVIETIVADEWDERIDAVTRTFLGLTVSCARCHNHKFDPITIDDYYALAGVMASTRLTERPLLPGPLADEVRAARAEVAAWEQTIQQLTMASGSEAISAETATQLTKKLRRQAHTPHYHDPWAHVVDDALIMVLPDGTDATRVEYRPGMTADLPIFRRGNVTDRGAIVPRRFLEVLSQAEPVPFRQGSGRAELADAILTQGEGLAARVLVNRIWAQIFGRGLVATPSDFGRQGDRPTHPELLDYLAARFVEQGWSMKGLIREIVRSETFQQSSFADPVSVELDPEARWLSRFPRRRLEIEPWRDTLLVALGELDDRIGGPAQSLESPTFQRRTLYGRVVREELDPLLRLFDFPEASVHSPAREPTTTPVQQLFVLNGPLMQQWSKRFAARLMTLPDDDDARITAACRWMLQRDPTDRERAQGRDFLATIAEVEAERWSAYAQVLLGLNEVLFLE
jgi:hypothetical protein